MSGLKAKTISGFFWTFLQKMGSQGIYFIVMIVLARLLTPADFGLIAMLSIFIQISQNVVDGGFAQALIQKLEVDDIDYSSVFYINVAVSALIYLVLFLIAPWVADFYHQPLLTTLLRVLSLNFVINSFSLVQETKIKNDLDFKKLAIIQVPSNLIGAIVAVVMAWKGFGVWSIVGLQIATRLAYSCQLWFYTKWRPLWVLQWDRVRTLFSFGGRMLVSTILTAVYSNIIIIIVGRFYAVSQVGFYQNAKTLSLTPSATIKSVADAVTYPVFAKLQNENERLKYAYKKVMQILIFWMLPAFTFAAVLAEPLISLVFGQKWLPAVPYFRWLCAIAVLSPLVNYNLNVFKIKGEAKLFLRLQIYRRILTIVAMGLIMLLPWGIMGLLFVETLSYVCCFIIFSHISGKFIDYGSLAQIKDKIPVMLAVGLIGFLLFFVAPLLKSSAVFIQFVLPFSTAFCLFIGVAVSFKYVEWKDSIVIARQYMAKLKLR